MSGLLTVVFYMCVQGPFSKSSLEFITVILVVFQLE